MQISLIICIGNRAPQLEKTLQNLTQLVDATTWELTVVDNASSDGTQAAIAQRSFATSRSAS